MIDCWAFKLHVKWPNWLTRQWSDNLLKWATWMQFGQDKHQSSDKKNLPRRLMNCPSPQTSFLLRERHLTNLVFANCWDLFFVEKIGLASPWLWSLSHSKLQAPDTINQILPGGQELARKTFFGVPTLLHVWLILSEEESTLPHTSITNSSLWTWLAEDTACISCSSKLSN